MCIFYRLRYYLCEKGYKNTISFWKNFWSAITFQLIVSLLFMMKTKNRQIFRQASFDRYAIPMYLIVDSRKLKKAFMKLVNSRLSRRRGDTLVSQQVFYTRSLKNSEVRNCSTICD
ncbi:hypothetical protein SS50377_21272 [Spironucleus salmonicida]|uniref:Uncharacterized protein n=1 Tax=Spironucleus salmonicida TaxID=348837 RepID=A0A9P8M3P8_9EUKA|nr:hypothetical protein SS50377_21272 [Spironucleus salmonicida]